ncbi:MAG: HAD family hydrolase [Verrucomicrobiota bacterium]
MKKDQLKIISFDYGNTVIEFGPDQIRYEHDQLVEALESMFGPCSRARLEDIRNEQIVAPFKRDYVENDTWECCAELVRWVYNTDPEPQQVDRLVEVRYQSFMHTAELPAGVKELLLQLKEKYRLALISNYPNGRSIRDSMAKLEIDEVFDAIVVSGEVGYVKPHALPFETMLKHFDEEPASCIHIGDNWLADIQGAMRLGMQTIYTSQYVPYENIPRNDEDHQPTVCIRHFDDLARLLL